MHHGDQERTQRHPRVNHLLQQELLREDNTPYLTLICFPGRHPNQNETRSWELEQGMLFLPTT